MIATITAAYASPYPQYCTYNALANRATTLRVQRVLVLEQLLDEIDVRHDHAAAAVAVELQLVHGVAVADVLFEELEVALPEVADNLWGFG